MELLQLKYFLEVAKSQQLTKTAREFFVSPSAVSTSISRLEDELGVELFDRVGRNIRLNEYGQIFFLHISDMFDILESAQTEIRELQDRNRECVTVSVTSPVLWGAAIRRFHDLYPQVRVRLFAFDTGVRRASLPNENVDFVIAPPSSFQATGWRGEQILDDILVLAVPPNHRFAGRTSLDLAEAKDEWFINLLPSISFRKYCDELCRQAGFTPKSKVECDYTMRTRMLPAHDMVCITTRQAQLSGAFSGAAFIPIVSPPCHRPQFIFWKKSQILDNAPLKFKKFLLEFYQNYNSTLSKSDCTVRTDDSCTSAPLGLKNREQADMI